MRIDNIGNVGIGTTAPDAKLSVNGAASFGDGTAAAPSIANFGDLNTGIFFPAADTIAFTEGGIERLRITSAGNVGIGTSSPEAKLCVSGASSDEWASSSGSGLSLNGISSGISTITTFLDTTSIRIGAGTSQKTGMLITGQTSGSGSTVQFRTGNSERLRITSAGNVGIGTSSPDANLTVNGAASFAAGTALLPSIARAGDLNTGIFFPAADTIAFTEGGTEAMRIDSSANLQFNSGFGSVATAFGCRAWFNLNGQGVISIRGSGNISSMTDNGTGDYTANFTNALTDANYSTVLTCKKNDTNRDNNALASLGITTDTYSSSAVRFIAGFTSSPQDMPTICGVILR
jgi:hypothetical protein